MAFDLPTNFTVGNETLGMDGIGSLFIYAQYATGDVFGAGILIVLWLIAFGVGSLVNAGRAFASASFITFVFSVYFARLGALNPTYPFILMILTIIGFFLARSERSASY